MSKQARTVNIHGKEYETVASRVEKFREDNPDYAIVKKEIYDSLNLDILLVIDDRQRVVDMFREQGLIVLQANKGDF